MKQLGLRKVLRAMELARFECFLSLFFCSLQLNKSSQMGRLVKFFFLLTDETGRCFLGPGWMRVPIPAGNQSQCFFGMRAGERWGVDLGDLGSG